MKKLDVNTVGMVWTVVFLIGCVIVIGFFEFWLAMLLLAMLAAFAFFIGVPYLITYLWNRFVAK